MYNFPTSTRILIPDQQPDEKPNMKRELSQRTVKSANVNNVPGNINSMISRTDREDNITKCRRAPNSRDYKSFTFQDILNETTTPYKKESR